MHTGTIEARSSINRSPGIGFMARTDKKKWIVADSAAGRVVCREELLEIQDDVRHSWRLDRASARVSRQPVNGTAAMTRNVHRAFRILWKVEDIAAIVVLCTMTVLAATNAVSRIITTIEIPAAGIYIQELNLALTFLGAIAATRAGRHLTLTTGHGLSSGRVGKFAVLLGGALGGAVAALLAWASWNFTRSMMDSPVVLPGGVPQWVFLLVIPLGFLGISLHFFFKDRSLVRGLMVAVPAAGVLMLLPHLPGGHYEAAPWVAIGLLVLSGFLGTPIFILMTGIAMILFVGQDVPITAVPAATYSIVTSPNLHVIPLFAFAGYLLARGGASRRLIALFSAWFGWMPGGIAVVTALVCAFFTTFTGASGVTILGLGGLLLPLLIEAGYPAGFSLGLLTAAGSLGMLFPPSLPVILYGVRANVSIIDMFLGGIVPGVFLLLVVSGYGVYMGARYKVPRPGFTWGKAFHSLWIARYEVLLPVVLFSGLFGGVVNLGEAAALTVLYVLFVECVLTRELRLTVDVPAVALECAIVVGALMIIFGAALGLTDYLVDAEIPHRLTAWAVATVHEKWLFILVLNVVLLVVGSLMEGFSAIVILVPLITPIGTAFGFDPVHLGILFLANLEAGFLLPPIGLNLFLSSMRFERPLASMYKPVLPFLLLVFAVVLVISYVPEVTLVFLR